jgi:hypothetical protein
MEGQPQEDRLKIRKIPKTHILMQELDNTFQVESHLSKARPKGEQRVYLSSLEHRMGFEIQQMDFLLKEDRRNLKKIRR